MYNKSRLIKILPPWWAPFSWWCCKHLFYFISSIAKICEDQHYIDCYCVSSSFSWQSFPAVTCKFLTWYMMSVYSAYHIFFIICFLHFSRLLQYFCLEVFPLSCLYAWNLVLQWFAFFLYCTLYIYPSLMWYWFFWC